MEREVLGRFLDGQTSGDQFLDRLQQRRLVPPAEALDECESEALPDHRCNLCCASRRLAQSTDPLLNGFSNGVRNVQLRHRLQLPPAIPRIYLTARNERAEDLFDQERVALAELDDQVEKVGSGWPIQTQDRLEQRVHVGPGQSLQIESRGQTLALQPGQQGA